jgi:LmbE family N-acetylglucosaminyl deacetylase
MHCALISFLLIAPLAASPISAASVVATTDQTNYNAGREAQIRLQPAASGTASIRYAGEQNAIAKGIRIDGAEYKPLWRIPWDARTGRYEVDITTTDGKTVRDATSFAVHRQLVKVQSVELDKTFYTSGDSINPRIVVKNLSNRTLHNLQVEFEPYTYPWIAPDPDEPPMWKHIVTKSLSLAPGAEKEFDVNKAAVVQTEKEPMLNYYSVVIRDSQEPDHIYDLAFALPAFTAPPNTSFPKQYPFLYLYSRLNEVSKSEAYRHFYPPEFVSDAISFDTTHTMFPTGVKPTVRFSVKKPSGAQWNGATIAVSLVDASGKEIIDLTIRGEIGSRSQTVSLVDASGKEIVNLPIRGEIGSRSQAMFHPLPPGNYTVKVSIHNAAGAIIAQNQLEIAVNPLPKSILVFCAHQDDDTAHPGIIRAAVENRIPIHFVYFTGGDAGGCDRYYMHSCDAARAMDFGEVRMDEARASLGHMGVPRDNLFFLGTPDGGLGQIWYDHLKRTDPYLSVLLASDHSPYRDSAIPNLPYSRESAVDAAKQFIARFKPDVIITGHPDERHVDHRTNNWIVVKAMQEMLREGTISHDTKLLVDVVYGALPGRHAPYRYEKDTFYVSGEAAKLGQEATWYYQSQEGNHQQANIVDFDKLPRHEFYPHFWILDWQDHAGWNEQRPANQ